MSILIAIIILIALAILDSRDKEKTMKPVIVGYKPVTGEPIFNKEYDIKPISYDIHTGKPIYDEEDIQKEAPKVKTEEDKTRVINSILMITGAILIVFASIIFLATSWKVLDGIVKTLILVAIQVVFYLFYKICRNTFNIPKTAGVFKYLSLIFVPIVLLSLSCFEIVGEYLSVGGAGSVLFFGISFILTDIIYKLINKFEKDKVIAYMSYICEILGIFIVFVHYFPNDPWALIIITMYSFIYYLLIELNVVNKDYYLNINHIVNYIIIALTLLMLEINGPTYIINGSLFIQAIYYFVKYQKNSLEIKQRRYIIYFLSLYIASLTILTRLEMPPYFAYNLALIPLLLLTKVIKKDYLKNVLLYGIMVICALVTGIAIIEIINKYNIVNSEDIYYLLTFIAAFVLYVITYVISKKGAAKIFAYSAFTLIFMEILKIVELDELNKYILLVTIVLIYFLEVLFEKLKDKSTNFFIPSLIIIESIVLIKNYAVLIPLIYMILYIKAEKQDEGLLIIPMLTSLSIFSMSNSLTSRIVSYVLIAIYSLLSLNKKDINVYTIISFIAIYYAEYMFNIHPIAFGSLLVLWSGSHLFVNKKNTIYKFALITSVLILYLNSVKSFEFDMISPYLFGAFLYVIALTRCLFVEKENELKPFECISIAFITMFGITRLSGPNDAVVMIFSLLILASLAFTMKWNHITYTSLICLVINIIYLTAEYWSQIPWYVYILIVGLALIILAMLDEKRKLNKKKKEQEQVTKVDTK